MIIVFWVLVTIAGFFNYGLTRIHAPLETDPTLRSVMYIQLAVQFLIQLQLTIELFKTLL